MASVRQIWVWSLPTLAVLVGFIWYKRKKGAKGSDPGGTAIVKDREKIGLNGLIANDSNKPSISDNKVEVKCMTAPASCFKKEGTFEAIVKSSDCSKISDKEDLSSAEMEKKKMNCEENFESEIESGKVCEKMQQKLAPVDERIECKVKSEFEFGEVSIIAKVKDISETSDSDCAAAKASEKTQEDLPGEQMTTNEVRTNGESSVESNKTEEHRNASLTGESSGSVEAVIGSERDSANHSPADVMLGSPSISHFSDEHSEHSSDSGKGLSEFATPPPHTPVSNSVAGDNLGVYEFIIPQQYVGMLIGKRGASIHHIQSMTNANIFIKTHPETTKLKICAIEGSMSEIDSALEMIRQKFPEDKFPDLTLEQEYFVSPPVIPDNMQLSLFEGINNDVMVSSFVTPAHFFVQQPTHPMFQSLFNLNECMKLCYKDQNAPMLPTSSVGAICAAPFQYLPEPFRNHPEAVGWYRAQIVDTDDENNTSKIKFIDYGGYMTIENSILRQIRSDFMTLPFQAIECYLAYVKPPGEEEDGWSMESLRITEDLTKGQVLQAQVCGYAEDGVPVILLFSANTSKVVFINKKLVVLGYAEWAEFTPESVTEMCDEWPIVPEAVCAQWPDMQQHAGWTADCSGVPIEILNDCLVRNH